jgi:tRNA(fMet)-specific endonuclease VapC
LSLLLDTNICVAWLNGSDASLRKKIEHAPVGDVFICSVVKAELLYAARKSARVSANLERLETFFQALPSLPFDDDAADVYGSMRAQLERQGTPLGPNGLMIAAIALVGDKTLITRNDGEFRPVVGLRIQVW